MHVHISVILFITAALWKPTFPTYLVKTIGFKKIDLLALTFGMAQLAGVKAIM